MSHPNIRDAARLLEEIAGRAEARAVAADAALAHARSLYDRGQIDLLPLLDAQRAQLQTRLGANDSQTDVLLDSVRLFKSLGGGWQAFEPAATSLVATPATSRQSLSLHEDRS
jgi:outer membrane protein TolC